VEVRVVSRPFSSAPRRSPGARARRCAALAALAAGLLTAAWPARVAAGTSAAPSAGAAPLGSAPACGVVPAGHVRCLAELGTAGGRVRRASAAAGPVPGSYTPSDLASAYALPTATGGSGQRVAIIDAYDDPSAESDLGVYRSRFSLVPCTTANGCFRKVDQNGGRSYPSPDSGWASETSLDLDMVSAVCPRCSITLVEASSDSLSDIYQAVREAVALGAREVSMSLGGSEYPGEVRDDATFNHPGVAMVASSGDSGYGVEYPAASRYVTAVGGTTLRRGGAGRGWTETAWSGAGSGCSAYESKPSWQTDSGCPRRTVADVSAVADPSTGVAVYDTYGDSGWAVYGGTSVAAPVVAASYALGGGEVGATGGYAFYQASAAVNDVTSGANGTCSPRYLCTATAGYDGPTGMGSLEGAPFAALAKVDSAYVANLYHDVLGRTTAPGAGEIAYWAGQLDRGAGRAQVATAFVTSSEAHGRSIDADYQLMLLRGADAPGRTYWTSQLNGGTANETVLGALGGGAEYYGSAQKGGGTTGGVITSLYRDLLHRSPGGPELAYWSGQLAAGTTRAWMATAVATSHEYHLVLVQGWYQHDLGRSADAQGAQYWATSLDRGTGDDTARLSVLTSDEYFSRPSAF
jgi:Domain of unknown function (DUF4214)/Subtilase family